MPIFTQSFISFALATFVCPMALATQTQPKSPPVVPEGLTATFTDEGGTVTLDNERFLRFLVDTRGLDALLNLMQLELAKEQLRRRELELTKADIDAERERTLGEAVAGVEGASDVDRDELLRQLLAQRQLSIAEFDVIIETNAALRKLAGPLVRATLTDELLRKAFAARYGEQARVRVIAMADLQGINAAKRRIDAGEDFETLARSLNTEATLTQNGGAIPPFNRQADHPQAFRDAAFAMQPGEVSDAVSAGEYFFLIKLEELIPPRVVEYENVKDALAEQIVDEQAERLLPELRRRLSQVLATAALKIEDPVLQEQLEARLAALVPQETSPDELKQRMEQERPTTLPGKNPD